MSGFVLSRMCPGGYAFTASYTWSAEAGLFAVRVEILRGGRPQPPLDFERTTDAPLDHFRNLVDQSG